MNAELTKMNLQISENEKKEIIELYALKICLLWEYYENRLNELAQLIRDHVINKNESRTVLQQLYEETRHIAGSLLIEQFYNTGEEGIFDRAMMMDEEVELKPVSIIDLDEPDSSALERGDAGGILLYYQGLFLYLSGGIDSLETHKFKIVIRDPDSVTIINRKISRGRMMLAIDEVTLGKKFYEGLCERTHY